MLTVGIVSAVQAIVTEVMEAMEIVGTSTWK